jgi:citronellol/citronellal dehydrogenase
MYHSDLFKDQIALITGGRSGIGYAIAKQMLELGAKVFITSRKEELLRQAAAELSKIGPCAYHPCDIRDVDQIASLAEQIQATYGRLDILVNNAGGQFPALAENISPNGWNAVINNNMTGTFLVSKQMLLSFFKAQKSGVIVNITANVTRGFPGMAHSSAARAAVENLTKTLACEWARFNVRMNAIAPGTIQSSGLDTYPEPIKMILEGVKDENLMGRLGSVEDVSNAVCFLASPLSAYISGISLQVDGMEHLHSNRMSNFEFLRKLNGE